MSAVLEQGLLVKWVYDDCRVKTKGLYRVPSVLFDVLHHSAWALSLGKKKPLLCTLDGASKVVCLKC